MNITELEKLAKAVYSPTKDNWEMRHAFAAFNKEANPQTIIQLIELLKEMAGALEDVVDPTYSVDEALAKYEEMTK